MSEMDEESIITLTDENGEESPFLLVDVVTYKQEDYLILLPLDEEGEENDEDEVVILKVTKDERGQEMYVAEEDEAVLDAVFALFEEQSTTDEDED